MWRLAWLEHQYATLGLSGGRVSTSIYKEIGYDIMEYLYESFPNSKLTDVNEHGCYQRLFLANGASIHYTKWRQGTMPFYIILYNNNGQYVFELDLSMLAFKNDYFQWHLKKPQNKSTLSVLQNTLGERLALPDDYINIIRTQKLNLNSGVNTPKNGFHFLFHVTWEEMVQKLTELIIMVLKAHGIQIRKSLLEEAKDDNQELELQRRRARRGQRRLRLKLLELYECKCAITGYAPTEVLEAAHIVSHAISGVNHSDNGLLLRADIHSLFDSNLLRINPETLEVVIDSSLKATPYWKLKGQQLRKRIDGSYPSNECLKQKWFGGTI
ncbi:hypothetical protein D3C78_674270 [compost metagenome]